MEVRLDDCIIYYYTEKLKEIVFERILNFQ